jgi:hypothetical protein
VFGHRADLRARLGRQFGLGNQAPDRLRFTGVEVGANLAAQFIKIGHACSRARMWHGWLICVGKM